MAWIAGRSRQRQLDFARLVWTQVKLLLSKLHSWSFHFDFVHPGSQEISRGVCPIGLPSIRTMAFAGADFKVSFAASFPAPCSSARRFASWGLLSVALAASGCLSAIRTEAGFLSGDSVEFILLLSPAKPVLLPVAM